MKNEHRKIGNELKLFNLAEYSAGMVNWYPKGYYIFQKIEEYIRSVQKKYDYQEIKSPIMANSILWEKSGHLDKFSDNMFFLENEKNNYAIKPMSCPFHIEIFNNLVQSYNELPLRLSEFGLCHRNEASGALNGLLRLRSFHQDDGHIFCREKDIYSELNIFVQMLFEIYSKFGFDKDSIKIKISLRPLKRIGSDNLWDVAEKCLQESLDNNNIKYELLPNEGAFYGPKIEFSLKDSLNREWQCGTFQLDFMLAEKMNASYVDSSGKAQHPIILHRAVLGSLERFIAILLEHYDGKLPLWINPNAVHIMPLSKEQYSYAKELKLLIESKGVSANIDFSEETLGKKIKNSHKLNANIAVIIGEKEVREKKISFNYNNEKYYVDIDEFIKILK